MSDYTPTLGEAEGRYSAGRLLLDGARDSGTATDRYGEFYRMIAAIERDAVAKAVDETALRDVIDTAQRRWNGSGRHEPLADAITRAVAEHLRGIA